MVLARRGTCARKSRSVAAGTLASMAALSLVASCGPGAVTPGPAAVTPGLGLEEPADATPPNIVLVLTDDQRFDQLGQMPTVQDRLIARGMRMDRAYAVNALCAPSRASLLTGRYSRTNGMYLNGDSPEGGGFPDFEDGSTVATWLHHADYHTGLFGKYLNHYEDTNHIPPGWDRWVALLAPNAMYYDYDLTIDGSVRHFGWLPDDYATDVYARYADAFIRRAPADEPLLAWVAPPAPHGPTTPPPRYTAADPGLTMVHRPNFDEADVTDKPAHIRSAPRLTSGVDAALDIWWRQAARSLRAVDDLVATLLEALHDTGRLKNTLFVFTSDNGIAVGEHRWRYKMDPYEESIRVPMVVRWDKVIAPGSTSSRLVTNIDLAPTFAAVAGTAAPHADGVSMLPVLRMAGSIRYDFLIEHQYFGAPYDPPSYCAVRSGAWLFVHYATGEEELYDLRTDPYEMNNRAYDADHRDRLRILRTRDRILCRPLPPGMKPF